MKSLLKALDLLDALAAFPGGEAGVSELARLTEIDKAIIHRMLRTLLSRDVVAQDPVSKRYRLGSRLVDWTGQRLAGDRPLEVARPHLLQLWSHSGETVHFTVPQGDQVMVVQVLESVQPIRVSARMGERVPMHCTASGKLFLALGGDSLRERLLSQPLAKVTDRTIVSRKALAQELATIRRDGYAFDREEAMTHATAVAAPVLDSDGQCRAAVALIGPMPRFTDARVEEARVMVVAAAKEITAAVARLEPGQWRF